MEELDAFVLRHLLKRNMTKIAKQFGELAKVKPAIDDRLDAIISSYGTLKQQPSKVNKSKKEESGTSDSSDDSDSESSGSSDEEPKTKAVTVTSQSNKRKRESSSSEEDSSDDEEEVNSKQNANKKKAKLSPAANNVLHGMGTPKTPITNGTPKTPQMNSAPKAPKSSGKKSNKSTPNAPFRRVREEEVEIPENLLSNSFETKRDSWGQAAYNVLKHTKGKSFRHEKTKMKRGSYRGGTISTEVHSIKFDDSD